MNNILDVVDTLHSALYLVKLVGLAGQGLPSDARGPIMRGTEAAAEEIEKALDLIERTDNQRIVGAPA